LRAGDHIYVTGTAPVDEAGKCFAPGDASAQTRRCLESVLSAANRTQAERAAQRARELSPDRSTTRLSSRLDTAIALGRRGKFHWAELEYRQVIDAGLNAPKVKAGLMLAEMEHDQGKELSAAEALAQVLEVDERELTQILAVTEQTVEGVRARMNFFHACHWAGKDDPSQHRQFLDEALKHDPAELDALIARYRLPDTEPEYHRKTIELIAQAASLLRQQIHESPDEPALYNQFAWLVGNTEGDPDEALRCAKKAVELRPESSAFLDTLGHVYFGRGDLENAVKHQARAAEIEPHSGLITQKLDLFRSALDESKNDKKQDQERVP